MTTYLRGRIGVVTGAGRGIGRCIATALAAEGMSLLLIDRDGSRIRFLADELADRFRVRCLPAAIDVSDQAAVGRVVMHAEQQLGAVDVLVQAAGGSHVLSEALLPAMQARGRGHIVEVAGAASGASHTATLAEAGVVAIHVTVGECAADTAAVVVDAARGHYDFADNRVIDATAAIRHRP